MLTNAAGSSRFVRLAFMLVSLKPGKRTEGGEDQLLRPTQDDLTTFWLVCVHLARICFVFCLIFRYRLNTDPHGAPLSFPSSPKFLIGRKTRISAPCSQRVRAPHARAPERSRLFCFHSLNSEPRRSGKEGGWNNETSNYHLDCIGNAEETVITCMFSSLFSWSSSHPIH